ncbi:MAG: precorrin-6y C5,15-methyltransferase (decarboxylating) subunit CbiE [Planctomycetota bacterium]|nr:precorrin-6y C5,15-methyltransferase (decarboxylating) subunit CbiE [Planctomycetota bacterium]
MAAASFVRGIDLLNHDDKIIIVGIGDDGPEGLTRNARAIVENASLLIGPSALTAEFSQAAECWDPGSDFEAIAIRLESETNGNTVVLAAGDPLFYGTARYLCDRLGKDRFEVIPHVSTMQLAFARVKENWDEAYLTNLANQPLPHVIEKIRIAERVGAFTDTEHGPQALAQALIAARIEYFTAYVCENLGSPDERVTSGELAEIADLQFDELNVMILVRKAGSPDRPVEMIGKRLFGNPDEMFLQTKPKRGLLTSSEIRCLALAELDLGATSVVWDIGAGSGSVAIEAAQIAPGGRIYAIEMDVDDFELIGINAERFGVTNVTAINGSAPEAWVDLPDPDAIFIGGTGRQLARIVRESLKRLKSGGRIVTDMASTDNLSEVQGILRESTGDVNVWMMNVARGNYQLESVRFDALNPKFLLSAVKP